VPLNQLQGQHRAVALLQKLLSGGRVHHAYLFSGHAGADQREAAIAFAQALNCPVDPQGCGNCDRCQRIARRSHPDLLTLVLDPEAPGREIRVEPVRQLSAALQLAASDGPYKVAIIEDADRLNPSAQNALLKILEEPPPKTVLILISDGEETLLPTVRSRCLQISFSWRPLAGSTASSPSTRDPLIDELTQLLSSRGSWQATLLALALAEHFSDDRERALQAAGEAAVFLGDLLRVMSDPGGNVSLANADKLPQLRELASRLVPADVLDGLDSLEEAILALQGNGAARLQLEAMALKLGQAA
jgi:DNA polymerase-3 subunit delta'